MLRSLTFCLCLLAPAALAHASKEGTLPADGATVAAVPVIMLDFGAPILITAMSVTGPGGDVPLTHETAKAAKATFRASPDIELPPGIYAVEWRGLAEDGHVMPGGFGFTVAAD